MSELDIRIKYSFKNNRKRRRLFRELGAAGVLALIDLWLETSVQYPSGVLKGCDEEDIAEMCNWKGEKTNFISILKSTGFIHKVGRNYVLNDWEEHQAWVVNAPARSEKARHAARIRWGIEECSEDASSNATSNAPLLSSPIPSLPTPPYKRIQEHWNTRTELSGLRKCLVLSKKIKTAIKSRWADDWFRENWELIFSKAHGNQWCREKRVGIDHVLRPGNAQRYYEESQAPDIQSTRKEQNPEKLKKHQERFAELVSEGSLSGLSQTEARERAHQIMREEESA